MFWSASSAAGVSVADQARQQPAGAQERGTAARRPAARGRPRRTGAGRRPACATVARVSGPTRRMPGCRSSSSRTAQTERFRRRAMLTIAVRSSPPSPYDLGRRERVQVDARVEVGDDAQERQQQADLGPGVQPGRAREAPRDAGHVERAQDRVGVAVGPDEDGVVARRGAGRDPPADLGGDPVRLLGARREGLEPDRARRAGETRCGPEPLDDAGPDLEPVRVVEPDEPVGGVEDRRERPVVAAQDDRPGADGSGPGTPRMLSTAAPRNA